MKREPLIEVHGVAAPLLRDDVDPTRSSRRPTSKT